MTRNKESDAILDSKKDQLVAEQVSNQNQVAPSIPTGVSKEEENLPRKLDLPIVKSVGVNTDSDDKQPNATDVKANSDEGEGVGSNILIINILLHFPTCREQGDLFRINHSSNT